MADSLSFLFAIVLCTLTLSVYLSFSFVQNSEFARSYGVMVRDDRVTTNMYTHLNLSTIDGIKLISSHTQTHTNILICLESHYRDTLRMRTRRDCFSSFRRKFYLV